VIPNLIVFAIFAFVGAFVWIVAVFFVLLNEKYPESLWRFLRGLVRWGACLFAYLASLAEPYPPFTLETSSPSSATPAG
jgi:Domain of unknown function (DUF4389)